MVCSSIRQLIIVSILFIGLSCSPQIEKTKTSIVKNNKYDSEFPNENCSKQLGEISNTIYRINSIAFYKDYIFSDSSNIRQSELTEDIVLNHNVKSVFMDKSSSGTSTMLYSEAGKVALLTCAHIVDFPDTIITYFSNPKGVLTDQVQSIAFKEKETIYVAGFPGNSEVKKILTDKNLDLALIGNDYGPNSKSFFSVFNFPFGKSDELEWGDFVYIFGFPMNYKMVSKAIVSSPNYDKMGSFLIDAVVNRGYSGGIVLALRDGVPNFELVGLIEWISDENQNVLEPTTLDGTMKYDPIAPYHGELFVKQLQLLRYGITKVIPIEIIKKFLMSNQDLLEKNGYPLSLVSK